MNMLRLLVGCALGLALGCAAAPQKTVEVLPSGWHALGANAAVAVSGVTTLDKKPAVRGTLMLKVNGAWHAVEWEPPATVRLQPLRQ